LWEMQGNEEVHARADGRICEHGRERRFCKDCGGSSICEHGRERNRCTKTEAVAASASTGAGSPLLRARSAALREGRALRKRRR
jgi:hypothetical protein